MLHSCRIHPEKFMIEFTFAVFITSVFLNIFNFAQFFLMYVVCFLAFQNPRFDDCCY